MKRARSSKGYTVVEVMIVLAVSSALLVSAMQIISGQQQRTEFSQAIRDIESQIQDVSNDVATGYYANPGNFRCRNIGGSPNISSDSDDTQGQNEDCIFLGRAMHFGVSGTSLSGFNIYNIVGVRQAPSGREATTIAEARPVAMARGTTSPGSMPEAVDSRSLQYGLRLVSATASGLNIGTFGFVSQLGTYGASGGDLLSGAQSVDLVVVPGTALNQTKEQAVDRIGLLHTVPESSLIKNPSGGIQLCFQSGGTNDFGVITIGGERGGRTNTNLEVKQGSC